MARSHARTRRDLAKAVRGRVASVRFSTGPPNQTPTPPSPPVSRRATRRPREAETGQKTKPYLAAAGSGVEGGAGWGRVRGAREAGVSTSRPPPRPASSSLVRRGRRVTPLSPPNQSALRRSAARPRSPLDRLSGGLGWSGDPFRNGPAWIGLDWPLPPPCLLVRSSSILPSIHPSSVAALLGCISSDKLDCIFLPRSEPKHP